MRAQKGHKELIDAMEPLIRERPDVHLLFVGGGSPVFEQVQAYVAEKSLGKRIHLLGVRSDVPNLLAGFDLFALRSEEHTSELQSLMRISYAVFCLTKKRTPHARPHIILKQQRST